MSARITTSGSAVNQRGITAKRAIAAFNITAADLATTGDALFLCEIPAEMIITSIKLNIKNEAVGKVFTMTITLSVVTELESGS